MPKTKHNKSSRKQKKVHDFFSEESFSQESSSDTELDCEDSCEFITFPSQKEKYVGLYVLDKGYYPKQNTHIIAIVDDLYELIEILITYCGNELDTVFEKGIDNFTKVKGEKKLKKLSDDEYSVMFVEYMANNYQNIIKWTDNTFDVVRFDKFFCTDYDQWPNGYIKKTYTTIVGYVKGGDEYVPELHTPFKHSSKECDYCRDESPRKKKDSKKHTKKHTKKH